MDGPFIYLACKRGERGYMAIDFDAVWELISDEGRTVFSLGWDGDFPGGSGAAYVTEWKGLYFVTSSDFDDEGPFSSLEDALKLEYFSGPTPKPELSSSVLSKAKLKEMAHSLVTNEGNRVTINDERFVLRNGKLRSERVDSRRGVPNRMLPSTKGD
jgi:hypothetical protein